MLEDFAAKIARKIMGQIDDDLLNSSRFPLPKNYFHSDRTFIVSVTTRCNFKCPHCLRQEVDDNKTLVKDLPVSVFETVLRKGKKINFQSVALTGGEPILHPQFKELISLIKKYDYRFNFVSNGWLYENYRETIEQNKKNLNFISLSIDGITPEIHDAVRNKPGSFKRLMEAIQFYKKQGVPLVASFCATKNNFHQIEEFPDFCLKLGIDAIKWMTVIPVYDKSGAPMTEYILTDEERNDAFRKILNLQKKFKSDCRFMITRSFYPVSENSGIGNSKEIYTCPILNCHCLYIDHDGGALFCCDINRKCKNKPLIKEKGFEEALNITMDTANEIKKKASQILLNGRKIGRFCDFCNQNIESCLDSAVQRQGCG